MMTPDMITEYKQVSTLHLFFYFLLILYMLCCCCELKLESYLLVVLLLLRIKFGRAQISVPKIGISMSKTA